MIRLTHHIGAIDLGIDGRDTYFIITSNEPLTKREAEDWLADKYMHDTEAPGGSFCHNVFVTPHPCMDNAFIGIVQFRYDV
jgi:hypothetical protein